MLEYKIQLRTPISPNTELEYSDLYISKDGSYITGTMPISNEISNGSSVIVKAKRTHPTFHAVEYDDGMGSLRVCKIQTHTVLRQGYFEIPKEYDVIVNTDVILPEDVTFYPMNENGGCEDENAPYARVKHDVYYFFDKDNILYFDSTYKTLKINLDLETGLRTISGGTPIYLYNDKEVSDFIPFTNDEKVKYDANNKKATIYHKYYIEDSKVVVDGITYYLQNQLEVDDAQRDVSDDLPTPTLTLIGETKAYTAKTYGSIYNTSEDSGYSRKDWEKVIKFKIEKQNDTIIELDRVTGGIDKPFIYYNNIKYYVSEESLIYETNESGDTNTNHIINGGDGNSFYKKSKDQLVDYYLDVRRYVNLPGLGKVYENYDNIDTFTIDENTDVSVGYELWATNNNPTYLLLNVNTDVQTLTDTFERNIIVEKNDSSLVSLYLGSDVDSIDFVYWNGRKYYIKKGEEYILINNQKYKLTDKTAPNKTKTNFDNIRIEDSFTNESGVTNTIYYKSNEVEKYATIQINDMEVWLCKVKCEVDSEFTLGINSGVTIDDSNKNKSLYIKISQPVNIKGCNVTTEKEISGKTETVSETLEYNIFTSLDFTEEDIIEIDGQTYLVEEFITYKEWENEDGTIENNTTVEYVVNIEDKERYVFDIVNVQEPNILICACKDSYDPYEKIKTEDLKMFEDIISSIATNPHEYTIKLYNNTFDTVNYNDITDLVKTGIRDEFLKGTPKINLFKYSTNLTIPLLMDNTIANNLQQEMLIKEHYVKERSEQNINRIIDMEKELYHPAMVKNDKTLELADSVVFDLHFRTRNMEDWSVNEDIYHHVGSDTGTSQNFMCSWNVFDHYIGTDYSDKNLNSWVNQDTKKLKEPNLTYFPPSDLLYFLDFSDNDVYYQKSKIGKSFLRLMFYDSIDPYTQSLLATSTIFLDEKEKYSKYCDTNRMTFTRPYNTKSNQAISTARSVTYEPCYGKTNATCTFKDAVRIDSQIVVENKYNTSTSSEGFYLNLYKEYTDIVSGLHERTIYLKAQFNHAGTGKVIDMCFAFEEGENGYPDDITLYDFSDATKIEQFKIGYKLGQELYKHMYLPIKVKFDTKLNQYVYYLPKGMYIPENYNAYPTDLRINLFEIKVDNRTEDDVDNFELNYAQTMLLMNEELDNPIITEEEE